MLPTMTLLLLSLTPSTAQTNPLGDIKPVNIKAGEAAPEEGVFLTKPDNKKLVTLIVKLSGYEKAYKKAHDDQIELAKKQAELTAKYIKLVDEQIKLSDKQLTKLTEAYDKLREAQELNAELYDTSDMLMASAAGAGALAVTFVVLMVVKAVQVSP
jgi:hypothetical protein